MVAAILIDNDAAAGEPSGITATSQIASRLFDPAVLMVCESVAGEAGEQMSRGPSFADLLRRSATDLDKILTGAGPGDLPVERPTFTGGAAAHGRRRDASPNHGGDQPEQPYHCTDDLRDQRAGR